MHISLNCVVEIKLLIFHMNKCVIFLVISGLMLILLQQPLKAQTMAPDFIEESIDDIDIGYGLAIGDVDGDQRPDILLADQQQFVWYRNGDWKRCVMVDNLTENDNVCIAARDINGDGQVEVAVGARWNPGETTDTTKSGSVHYLMRPENPENLWQPIKLHHEPTVHRMQWVQTSANQYQLIVLPLHGRGNQNGKGKGVKIIAYAFPEDPQGPWDTVTIDQSMHMTHNLTVLDDNTDSPSILIAGKEGVVRLYHQNNTWSKEVMPHLDQGAGEVSIGQLNPDTDQFFIATIEPMHGNRLMVYQGNTFENRSVLFDNLAQGHALACGDLLGLGRDQIVVGWRNPNKEGKVGIKMFVPVDEEGDGWMHYFIDDNGMACEDLKVADLDLDGDLDIVAAGRDTHNLKIYWNQLKKGNPKGN